MKQKYTAWALDKIWLASWRRYFTWPNWFWFPWCYFSLSNYKIITTSMWINWYWINNPNVYITSAFLQVATRSIARLIYIETAFNVRLYFKIIYSHSAEASCTLGGVLTVYSLLCNRCVNLRRELFWRTCVPKRNTTISPFPPLSASPSLLRNTQFNDVIVG